MNHCTGVLINKSKVLNHKAGVRSTQSKVLNEQTRVCAFKSNQKLTEEGVLSSNEMVWTQKQEMLTSNQMSGMFDHPIVAVCNCDIIIYEFEIQKTLHQNNFRKLFDFKFYTFLSWYLWWEITNCWCIGSKWQTSTTVSGPGRVSISFVWILGLSLWAIYQES